MKAYIKSNARYQTDKNQDALQTGHEIRAV
jgi:hypothetical protein